MKIDIDCGMNEVQLLFDVVEFLTENQEEIKLDIYPDVKKFLDHSDIFTGPFILVNNEYFEEFISKQLKERVMNHFNVTIEQANIIIEKENMLMFNLYDNYYNADNYKDEKYQKQ